MRDTVFCLVNDPDETLQDRIRASIEEIVADVAAYVPGRFRDRIRAYRDVLDEGTQLGIHAHENLSPSVATAWTRLSRDRDAG